MKYQVFVKANTTLFHTKTRMKGRFLTSLDSPQRLGGLLGGLKTSVCFSSGLQKGRMRNTQRERRDVEVTRLLAPNSGLPDPLIQKISPKILKKIFEDFLKAFSGQFIGPFPSTLIFDPRRVEVICDNKQLY